MRLEESLKYGRYVISTFYDTSRRGDPRGAAASTGFPHFPLLNEAGGLIPAWNRAVNPYLYRRYKSLFETRRGGEESEKAKEFEVFSLELKNRVLNFAYFEDPNRSAPGCGLNSGSGSRLPDWGGGGDGLPEECAEGFCGEHCDHQGCPTPLTYDITQGPKQRPRAEPFPWMCHSSVFDTGNGSRDIERASKTVELVQRLKHSVNLDRFRLPSWFPTSLGLVPPPMAYYPGIGVIDEFGDVLPYSSLSRVFSQEEHDEWSLGVCSGTTANHIAAYIENIAVGVPIPDQRCSRMVSPLFAKLHYIWTQTHRCPKFRGAFIPLVHGRHARWINPTQLP